MALADISAEAVRQAITEYRTLGEVAFLRKYETRSAKAFVVMDEDGEPCPAVAIIRAAHRIQCPEEPPLTRDEFSGGKQGKRLLSSLGFTAGKYGDLVHCTTAEESTAPAAD